MKLISILFTFSAALILTSSCSNYSSEELPDHIQSLENVTVHDIDSQPASSISLTETLIFGNSEDVQFGRIFHIDVDDSDNIYISEGSQGNEAIYVFDGEGNHVNTIGRSGDGPGEFRSIFDIKISNNQLFVLDTSLLRIQIFNTDDYSLQHEASLNPAQWDQSDERIITFPLNIFVLNDSTLLAAFNHMTSDVATKSYYHMDLDGNVISNRILSQDYIRQLPDPKSGHIFFDPFGGRGLIGVSAENDIYKVWSDELLFKVYDKDGSYLRAFYHPFRNSTLSQNEIVNEALNYHQSEEFKNAIQHHGIPDYWRALEHMIPDDENRLWISTITDDRDIYDWWVMDDYGHILAKFALPRSIEINKVKDDFLYSVKTDEETGLQQIVKYLIEWVKLD